MSKLPASEFQEYLNMYFMLGIHPKDLCPQFGLSVSNHSRRIRKAIEMKYELPNGVKVTTELYDWRRGEVFSENGFRNGRLFKDAFSRNGIVNNMLGISGKAGQIMAGRAYSVLEEYILTTGRDMGKSYSEISDTLANRTPHELRCKVHYMSLAKRPLLLAAQANV